MYLSYIFYFKESTITTKTKTKRKTNTKKYSDVKRTSHFQYCLTMSFKKQRSPFFVQLVLNLNQYPFVSFTIKGMEPSRSPLYLFSYVFPLSLLLANNNSLSNSHLKWIYNFKQICFPPKLVANEQLQKCFFGYS